MKVGFYSLSLLVNRCYVSHIGTLKLMLLWFFQMSLLVLKKHGMVMLRCTYLDGEMNLITVVMLVSTTWFSIGFYITISYRLYASVLIIVASSEEVLGNQQTSMEYFGLV